MRRLIINADDFGLSDDTVDATIELIELGIVTSATLLLCGNAIDRAIEFAQSTPRNCSFGLHFNIVDGAVSHYPSSLTDQNGHFRASMSQRRRALLGQFSKPDIEREFRWQVASLRERGVTISHVDSHGHLHKWPMVAKALAGLMPALDIRAMRRPQNMYFRRNLLDLLDVYCTWRFPKVRTTQQYCAIDSREPNWLSALPSKLPIGSTELSVHPGKLEQWRRNEFEPLINAGRSFFVTNDIELITFGDL